jgi:hypothetical protein
MNIRFLAFLILFVFVVLPAGAYWYFYYNNISEIELYSEEGGSFSVRMEGKFSFRYFPLLDRVFVFERACVDTCIIEPIPPLKYDLVITASGAIPYKKNVTVTRGSKNRVSFLLMPELRFDPIKTASSPAPSNDGEILGITPDGEVIAGRFNSNGSYSIFSHSGGRIYYTLPVPHSTPYLDISGTSIIFKNKEPGYTILSL